jgi:O-antigen ligase
MTAGVEQFESGTAKLAWSQRFVCMAIATSPFQAAFTLPMFELKASEVFLLLAILSFLTSRRRVGPRHFTQGGAFVFLLAWVALSTGWALLATSPPIPAPGYTRSLEMDAALYCGYAVLVLTGAAIAARTPKQSLVRAFIWAIWLSLAAIVVQFVLFAAGQLSLLETLGYQTERLGAGLGEAVLRTGPFVEGQHLGFFSAATLIIALSHRRYVAAVAAGIGVLYSQSTSSLIALVVAVAVVLLTRPRAGAALKIVSGAALISAVVLSWAPIRNFVQFQLAKLGLLAGAQADAVNDRSIRFRAGKTELAWDMALANPVFGVGPGRFGAWFSTFAERGDYELADSYFNGINRPIVENGYMQLAAESGLPALIALAVGLLIILARAYRHSAWTLALGVVLAVSMSTLSSWTFIPAWLVVGYLSSLSRSTGPNSSGSPQSGEGVTETNLAWAAPGAGRKGRVIW